MKLRVNDMPNREIKNKYDNKYLNAENYKNNIVKFAIR